MPDSTSPICLTRGAKSAPDGYTLSTGATSTFVISPHINTKLSYDPIKDFVPVAILGMITSVLVVNGNVPANSVSELVALAKANPGKLNYASLGTGSSHHLHGEQLRRAAGIDIVHVPYKGSPQALTALLAGEVQLFFFPAFVVAISNMQNGRLRALAVMDSRRSPAAPDVPTLSEVGYPIEAPTWHMLVAPGATPKPILHRLNAELTAIIQEPVIGTERTKRGIVPTSGGSPEQLATFVKSEIDRWGKVVRKAGAAGIE